MISSRMLLLRHSNRHLRVFLNIAISMILTGLASAQRWIPVATPFPGQAGLALVRTDGNVMVEERASGVWWLLIPDNSGEYTNGFWIPILSLQQYDPAGFASAILPDDRIIIEGGEHNFGQKVDTTKGAILDPKTETWTEVTPPAGWTKIGDAPSVVLPNKKFMIGSCCSKQQALLDASTMTWASTGGGKADKNSEEGWTLLPNGKVLTVDMQNGMASEVYDPNTGKWSRSGDLPFFIGNQCGKNIVAEVGPAILRPDGTVFAVGGNCLTAIYEPSTGTWSAGPSFPTSFVSADGPAAILPDGNVLVKVSPCFSLPSLFFEFDGTNLISVPGPPNSFLDRSELGHMVVLPHKGHILFTDTSSDVEVYVPNGAAKSVWVPAITSSPSAVTRGHAYTIKGKRFNGMTQGAAFGDDAQMATNFPLVRITNKATGHVFYARTRNFSSMGVATGSMIVSATFIPSSTTETGPSQIQVVANGLGSQPVDVTVQ